MANTAVFADVKALFFDVFGTTVDWRSTVVNELYARAQRAQNLSDYGAPMEVRQRASEMSLEDWGNFAQRWRESYYAFTKKVAMDSQMPYKSIDEHHLDSLKELLREWKLVSLWDESSVQELSLIWHKLNPWPDTVDGIKAFNQRFQTCTLSNGNVSLLEDMAAYAKLEWTNIFSAEMFKTYKPNPEVYLGGARKLGLKPTECAMVAAHLGDLEAAHRQGFHTIYVDRALEEQWDAGKITDAREQGWVDVWINENENGFLAAARKLGID